VTKNAKAEMLASAGAYLLYIKVLLRIFKINLDIDNPINGGNNVWPLAPRWWDMGADPRGGHIFETAALYFLRIGALAAPPAHRIPHILPQDIVRSVISHTCLRRVSDTEPLQKNPWQVKTSPSM